MNDYLIALALFLTMAVIVVGTVEIAVKFIGWAL